ncbi:MAG: hypothetical protein RBR69_08150 [Candidatus Cloacimonadaceae bacterium]|jgi:hypothetical protein|nr:hypothetical protein [Candidatus Cloacimonadota bacterium]MDY0128087.1 hypothetical protein [Candidatus Cloacimonadaceae bacterium]MCB5254137.1 hypothetical protein [Candidatus Cloacimonadota bacterium]MCK9178391.1 hypothetical protein [Candidatus Cloacimonadota bacterium]MCK9242650.1 hypothetical protein [Candidatus Cloacimonadota bacterium]
MNHPYSGLLKSLDHLSDYLVQVYVYQELTDHYSAVIIMDQDPEGWLTQLAPLAKYVQKHRLNLPLIINKRFIQYSLDSYPLEFINIISSQSVNLLLKEDLLSELDILPSDVRLQMEREFKSKWLLTRQVLLEGKLTARNLRQTLHLSIGSLIPALKGFFFLARQPYPQTLDDLFEQATLISKIDVNSLNIWLKQSSLELADAERYLSILKKLMEVTETYPIEP